MNFRSTLRVKTRQPQFLWRMVLWILAAGVILGFAAQEVCSPPRRAMVEEPVSSQAWQELDSLAAEGQWSRVWWAVPRVAYGRFAHVGPAALAVLTGCCWLVFLLQAVQVGSLWDRKLWLSVAGVGLGVLSIWPTLFLSLWQEHRWNLQESQELVPGLRFYILGVGLREELSKLLCLLPLVPLLRWIGREFLALVVGACVGLGFAAMENVAYIAASGGSTTGRFLVANPLHFALTGLVSLSVYRAVGNPVGWGPFAVATLGLAIVAHGLYDAALTLPDLADLSLLSIILFALIVYQFFHELRTLRGAGRDTVSMSATFLGGVSLITAATFVYLSATVGCLAAFDALVQGVLSLAVMVYLFLREMPETMVSV